MAFTIGSGTFTNGSATVTGVTLTSGTLAYFASGTRMVVGVNPVIQEVEAIAAPTVSTITLRSAWTGTGGTYSFLANQTSEGLRDAVQAIRTNNASLQSFIDSIDTAATANSVAQRTSDGSLIATNFLSGTTSALGKVTISDGTNPLAFDSATYNEIQSYNRPLLLNRQGQNVGIGTVSANAKLEVRYDVAAGTDLDPTAIKLYNNSDGGSAIEFSNAVAGKSKISFGVEGTGGSSDDTYIGFSTGANTALAERLRIDSSGKLLSPNGSAFVGTVSNSGSGAIIERGSNANGEYVKFADGTVIAYLRTYITGAGTSSISGAWTFPTSFITTSTTGDNRKRKNGSVSLLVGGAGNIYDGNSIVDNVNIVSSRINENSDFAAGGPQSAAWLLGLSNNLSSSRETAITLEAKGRWF